MIQPSERAPAAAARWRPTLGGVQRGGVSGGRLGSAIGASMEFYDRRPYQIGDDVRHIDWRAMARTDEVHVRLHQEEIVPRLDLVLDASASMAIEESKAQLAVDLAGFFAIAGRASGIDVRLIIAGDTVARRPADDFESRGVEFTSRRDFSDALGEVGAHLRPRSQRVIISDFLVPMDPHSIVRLLARGAGPAAFLQVLGPFDRDPAARGAVRLTDVESGQTNDVVLDARTIERYHDRLGRLTAGLAEEARRLGGVGTVVSGELDAVLDGLAREAVVAPV